MCKKKHLKTVIDFNPNNGTDDCVNFESVMEKDTSWWISNSSAINSKRSFSIDPIESPKLGQSNMDDFITSKPVFNNQSGSMNQNQSSMMMMMVTSIQQPKDQIQTKNFYIQNSSLNCLSMPDSRWQTNSKSSVDVMPVNKFKQTCSIPCTNKALSNMQLHQVSLSIYLLYN